MVLISLQDVSLSFGGLPVLDRITMQAEDTTTFPLAWGYPVAEVEGWILGIM